MICLWISTYEEYYGFLGGIVSYRSYFFVGISVREHAQMSGTASVYAYEVSRARDQYRSEQE